MNQVLLGAIGMAALAVSLIFGRYWRTTKDRLYLYFAASFCIQGIDRFLLGFYGGSSNEDQPLSYSVRLLAYLLIVLAIADKNRSSREAA